MQHLHSAYEIEGADAGIFYCVADLTAGKCYAARTPAVPTRYAVNDTLTRGLWAAGRAISTRPSAKLEIEALASNLIRLVSTL